MIRQTVLLTTLAAALVMAQADPATAQQTAARQTAAQAAEKAYQAAITAQAQKPQVVIAPVPVESLALEDFARSQAVRILDRAKVVELSALEFEAKLAAAEFAGQAERGVGQGSGQLWEDYRRQRGRIGQSTADKERSYYDNGTQSALDAGKWQAAVDAFDQVIKLGGTKTDGALYWKAYAQNRLGQRSEALATLDELIRKSPGSRWAGEARALQVEVRQVVGQPIRPEQESDEELKLLAIRGLMNTDAERAVPMLETIVQGSASPKLKDQALFVLGMSESPKAREILVSVAKGKGNPDLQLRAIKYLGTRNAEQNRPLLVEIYKSTTDVDVKRRVIDALVGSVSGMAYAVQLGSSYDTSRLCLVARPGRRSVAEAAIAAANDLWALYQAESEIQLKKQMLQGLAAAQSEKIKELARTEKNQELRQAAIQNLGMMSSSKTGEMLVSLYKGEKDPDLKKAIVRGLFLQRNATALVQIARQETDPAVKKDVVQKLSTMKDKAATDYMLELLKK